METIVNRIQKLLALGERGGTEAEADSAMRKVHELLAKHNLSLDDVQGETEKPEDYVEDAIEAKQRQPWQFIVWTALAELYFCHCHRRNKRSTGQISYIIIGKPSNIAVVKYMAAYIIRTSEELAREASNGAASRTAFINSFKKGLAWRLYTRVKEEIAKAKAGKVADTSTGTALILHPLYDQTKRDIEEYKSKHDINPSNARGMSGPSDSAGYYAGRAAADQVSLIANGVENKTTRQIAKGAVA